MKAKHIDPPAISDSSEPIRIYLRRLCEKLNKILDEICAEFSARSGKIEALNKARTGDKEFVSKLAREFETISQNISALSDRCDEIDAEIERINWRISLLNGADFNSTSEE